ncbi:hypothetical protein [Agaribacterium haliotis]|uniref:hypothetical protein n=1 Tax=Agaribacterium haliotis TaxID=2013869 RepID=UPI000BB5618E|nr:hypothetical protein [Agaribacterium haliotis]
MPTKISSSCLAFFFLLLSGCGGAPTKSEPLLSSSTAQIQSLQNIDELIAMRGQLAGQLQGKPSERYAEDYAKLALIDAQIVKLKKSELSSDFAAKRLDGEAVLPLSYLEAELTRLKAQTPIPADKWQPVISLVEAEAIKTGRHIEQLEALLRDEKEPQQQVLLASRLHKVTGYDEWQQKKQQLLDSLIADVRFASEQGRFDSNTLAKVEIIKRVRGDDAALLDEMIGVDAKIYAKQFFDKLAEGEADQAYEILQGMAAQPDFPLIKDKLAATSQKMADYFSALADESIKDKSKLGQSYRWYSQARGVRSMLEVSLPPASAYEPLCAQLWEKQLSLAKQGESEAVLAHLYAIQEFQPSRPGLRKAIVEQEAAVRDTAVLRLSTTDFQSPYKDQDYGDVISSFITQYLFEHVPYDVRIVEREQYAAILRERDISGETSNLSSVNLLVSGSVLESKVDSSEANNKKMMRVEVGSETIPNPSYISWLEMSSRERKKVDKPSETIDVSKYENISVGVTRHRKVGIFSVSYRLVEAASGKVIFPDSITINSEYQDDSSEGVEMGEFVIPFKLADLPSDVEILDALARQVAGDIGAKLVERLKDQDLKYLALADAAETQNDCAGEVQNLAKALMIKRLKERESTVLVERLRDRGVACYNYALH